MAVAAVREGAQDYLVKGRIDGARPHRSAIRYAIERKHIPRKPCAKRRKGSERRVEERTAELRA